MNQISHIRPIPDTEAAGAVSRETLADLAQRITSTPVPHSARPLRRASRRSWRAGIALAAALAVALLLAVTVGNTGTGVGPVTVGPANAQALSFRTDGRFIVVIVRNPLADLRRYRAELAAHHLNITLRLVPASPSLVGTLVEFGGSSTATQITPITARGRCWTGGGGSACPVGARIPIDFHGSADLTFGRATRPGEQYDTSAPATAPGEALHGLRFRGRTVAEFVELLRARHVTVPQYRWLTPSGETVFSKAIRPDQVPGNWHVYGAIPWAPGQVQLFVGPLAKAP